MGYMVNMHLNFFHMPAIHFRAVCTSIFYKSDGVFGIMANVLATYVILFVLFGAFFGKMRRPEIFVDFPLAAVGHKTGGPGKVAVIASGLFGSISGSAIANVVSTGAFTIPMMKKAGFRPHIAGGIEPAASISGMVHAAHYGRRRFYHGRAHGRSLFQNHAHRHLPRLDVRLQCFIKWCTGRPRCTISRVRKVNILPWRS